MIIKRETFTVSFSQPFLSVSAVCIHQVAMYGTQEAPDVVRKGA
jgi:hypothetical protein